MGKIQKRKSISLTAGDYLLTKKVAEKLKISQSALVTALVRVEAKKRRIKVSDKEVEAFIRASFKEIEPSEMEKRVSKLFPGAF